MLRVSKRFCGFTFIAPLKIYKRVTVVKACETPLGFMFEKCAERSTLLFSIYTEHNQI